MIGCIYQRAGTQLKGIEYYLRRETLSVVG
nr:MAG TPA: hypothetical protein [Caudoviricetes sp.]